ncbi:MAG: hypothetical protein AAGJ68_04265 [Pseudomonadota bacterium]
MKQSDEGLNLRIEAYVVAGDDDRYCDQSGHIPPALKHDAEWTFFQSGLDRADVSVMGREGHEANVNRKARRRLVLTRSVSDCVRDGLVVYWNPAHTGLETALALFRSPISSLAVVGGQHVFDLFLRTPPSYFRFHLSHIAGVNSPGGRTVFPKQPAGATAAAVLKNADYVVMEHTILAPGVTVSSWGKPDR